MNYTPYRLQCGPSLFMSYACTQVHVIRARRLARTVYRSCVACRRVAARTETQQMGQLPAPRVSPNPAFHAGPFLMKKGHSRNPIVIKMYLCVFVCFSTKAAHNEIVSDLTTEAFIACLKRFDVRSGLPAVIYIDNGSNYPGARNDLYETIPILTTRCHPEKSHHLSLKSENRNAHFPRKSTPLWWVVGSFLKKYSHCPS